METLKGCEGFHRRVRVRVRKSGPLLKPLTLVKGKGKGECENTQGSPLLFPRYYSATKSFITLAMYYTVAVDAFQAHCAVQLADSVLGRPPLSWRPAQQWASTCRRVYLGIETIEIQFKIAVSISSTV